MFELESVNEFADYCILWHL